MRFVFDTNVLVSALLFEESKPAKAFYSTMENGEILLSTDLVNEIHEVIYRKKFDRYISNGQRDAFLIALVQTGTLVEITETIRICRDPKDNMVLEVAVSGKADMIMTGDKDLLALHPFQGISILTPEDFITTTNL